MDGSRAKYMKGERYMITSNGEIIEVIPNLESPEEIARSFFHDRDIKLVEDKIEDLK